MFYVPRIVIQLCSVNHFVGLRYIIVSQYAVQ